jgi:hypothetical protein
VCVARSPVSLRNLPLSLLIKVELMNNVMANHRSLGRRVVACWGVLLLLGCGWASQPAQAGLGPENCVLVINGGSPESQRIGYQYAEWRKIHSRNVIVLSDVPAGEKCTVAAFKEKILLPIFQLNQLVS